MKLGKKSFVLSLLGVAVLAVIWHGLRRLDAEMECWECSVLSPSLMVARCDCVGLAKVVGVRQIAEIQYAWGGSVVPDQEALMEFVLEVVARAKGSADTVALWSLQRAPRSNMQLNDTILLYGTYARTKENLAGLTMGLLCEDCPAPGQTKALMNSSEVQTALEDRRGHMPILMFLDRGAASNAYELNHVCYYDESHRAHLVSAATYWKEIRGFALKGSGS